MEMKGKKKNKKKELANEDLQQKVGQALDAAAKNPVIKAIGKVIAPVGKGRGTVTKAEQERKIKEEVDLFDYLLEYLVAEGYADTNKAALAIMTNMSEEWRQIILEGLPGTPSTPRAGDAGTSGLKMIRTTGGQTGYTNKYSSGETLPSGTVNKIMSGNLMVKNNTKKNNNSNLA